MTPPTVAEPRAQIERQEQAAVLGPLTGLLQNAARLHAHYAIGRIDLLDGVHSLKRQRRRAIGARAVHESRAAAPWHHGLARLMRQGDNARHIGRRARP
jgi:hypothetical protein